MFITVPTCLAGLLLVAVTSLSVRAVLCAWRETGVLYTRGASKYVKRLSNDVDNLELRAATAHANVLACSSTTSAEREKLGRASQIVCEIQLRTTPSTDANSTRTQSSAADTATLYHQAIASASVLDATRRGPQRPVRLPDG